MARLRPERRFQVLTVLLSAWMAMALVASLSGLWRIDLPRHLALGLGLGGSLLAWLCYTRPRWFVAALLTPPATAALLLALGPLLRAGSGGLLAWLQRRALAAAEQAAERTGEIALADYAPPQVLLKLQSFAWDDLLLTWLRDYSIRWQGFWGDAIAQQLNHLDPRVAYTLLGVAALGTSLLALGEGWRRGAAFWTLLAGAVAFSLQWSFFYDAAVTHFVSFSAAGLAFWGLTATAHRAALWRHQQRPVTYGVHWAAIPVFAAVVTLVAFVLPSHWEPVQLGTLGDRLTERVPFLQRVRGGPGGRTGSALFSLQTTGFSTETGLLGGPAGTDDRIALRVDIDPVIRSPVFLRGMVATTYTGRGWEPAVGDLRYHGSGDALPGSSLAAEHLELALEIQAVGLYTSTIFHAQDARRVDLPVEQFVLDAQTLTMWSDAIYGRQSYRVQAAIPQVDAARLSEVALSAAQWPEHLHTQMQPYRQLPADLPPRVAELAAEIVAGQPDRPYDQAVAIERHLRSTGYNLEVPAPPPGRDFVDYFLFDLQEGYCTYHSTAMVVLLRTLGIPARWVQGFVLQAQGEGPFALRNSDAHAWVEAYFPNYGWVTFDPTPRFAPIVRRNQTGAGAGLADDLLDPLMSDDWNLAMPAPGPSPTARAQLPAPEAAAAAGRPAPPLLALLGVIAAGLLVALWQRERVCWHNPRLAVQQVFMRVSALATAFDHAPRPGETPLAYARSLAERWPEARAGLLRLGDAYVRARYGPPGDDRALFSPREAHRVWQSLRETLIANHGPVRYLWRRIQFWR